MSALFAIWISLDQEAEPDETRMVSPDLALLTQVATLVRSGVLCQVGLAPVQAAAAAETQKGANVTTTNVVSKNLSLVISFVFR